MENKENEYYVEGMYEEEEKGNIDKAIELAYSSPFPQIAIRNLIIYKLKRELNGL